MAQNGRMPPRFPLFAALLSLPVALAGCGERAPAPATRGPLDRVEQGNLAWGGVLPCADCDAIEVELRLTRQGARRGYRLVETFHAADGGGRFEETGRWRSERGLVRLEGDNGARRTYALLEDGRLQPRDAHGRGLAGADAGGDALVPLSGATR